MTNVYVLMKKQANFRVKNTKSLIFHHPTVGSEKINNRQLASVVKGCAFALLSNPSIGFGY